MRRHRTRSEQAELDIAAFLVVVGIMALIMRAGNLMADAGASSSRQWVVFAVFAVTWIMDMAWLLWRLHEHGMQR